VPNDTRNFAYTSPKCGRSLDVDAASADAQILYFASKFALSPSEVLDPADMKEPNGELTCIRHGYSINPFSMKFVSAFKDTCGAILLSLAALLCAALPGGYVPKFAGPCGKHLCYCQIHSPDDCDSTDTHTNPASPESHWIFVEQISHSDGQIVIMLNSLIHADISKRVATISSTDLQHDIAPTASLLSGHSVVLEYPTPPPRA